MHPLLTSVLDFERAKAVINNLPNDVVALHLGPEKGGGGGERWEVPWCSEALASTNRKWLFS